jgi:hypothetical protein
MVLFAVAVFFAEKAAKTAERTIAVFEAMSNRMGQVDATVPRSGQSAKNEPQRG